MWPKRLRGPAGEARLLLHRLRARGWKSDAEREELLRSVAALPGLEAEEVAWLAADSDVAVREAGLSLLSRFPYESAAEALFPLLSSRTEAVRRLAMKALESLAGAGFFEKLPGFLSHRNPSVVHAALDHLRHNPSERALPWVAQALRSPSATVRRKAFSIVEATPSPRVTSIAVRTLEDDDESLRFRAVQLLAKHPNESHIAPLLKRCHNDSTRVQEAAIAALTPALASSSAHWNQEIMPLLSDVNPKVQALASRILSKQEPAKVVDAFLHCFRNLYGPARDRAVEALGELGRSYICAFLDRDDDRDPAMAALASSIAVTIRSPEVVPHCIRFLESEDWWLRDRAAQALAEIRDESTLPALLKMLEDPESSLSAAAALGVWGTAQALPGLLEAYKKGARELRLEILDTFAHISDPRVEALLQSIVKADPDPLVKEKAIRLGESRKGKSPAGAAGAAGPRVFSPIDFASASSVTLQDLLRHARACGASDLHLSTATLPQIRTHGNLTPLPLPEPSEQQIESWIHPILGPARLQQLARGRQIDFCHKDPELGRFRTNVFFQHKGLSVVFRLVPQEIPNLTDIGLPESLWELTTYSQGLVLVTGPSGCGKTTTLAALTDRINETYRCHIITIEDPIEYVHPNKESLVNQREIPTHSHSFAKALRQTLREDPDVILVGEMRDLETISLAITASETGHLVLATLHTTTASSTIDRIINAFPPGEQGQIRMMIADSLKAVISQVLLPRRDGSGRVAAYEILRNTPAVAGLIRDSKTYQLPSAIQTGAASGMILMDGALLQLVQEGAIEPRVAYDRAERKEAFEPFLADEAGAVA